MGQAPSSPTQATRSNHTEEAGSQEEPQAVPQTTTGPAGGQVALVERMPPRVPTQVPVLAMDTG